MSDLRIGQEMALDSREVAEMVEKRHADLIRDMEIYIQYLENAKLRSQDFFAESSYKADGNNKTYKCYKVTKKGCEFIAHKLTGQKGAIFTANYINKFHSMESQIQGQSYMLVDPIARAKAWILEEEQRQRLLSEVEKQKPKVLFAEAVETSKSSILVGELSKLLKQNGVDIGQNRLFVWLRDNGYLSCRRGEMWNIPTQKSMDLGLFEIKKRTIGNADGSVRVTTTVKVTGKGQVYFVNKFIGGGYID